MKKKLIISGLAIATLCVAALISSTNVSKTSLSELSKANVEALAAPKAKKVETVADFARVTLGCPGGNNNCFSGSITFKGATLEGTWYLK